MTWNSAIAFECKLLIINLEQLIFGLFWDINWSFILVRKKAKNKLLDKKRGDLHRYTEKFKKFRLSVSSTLILRRNSNQKKVLVQSAPTPLGLKGKNRFLTPTEKIEVFNYDFCFCIFAHMIPILDFLSIFPLPQIQFTSLS